MDSLATSTVRRWALCSLLCLCLFSAGLLLGSRPFFFPALLPPPWEHFSRLQQQQPAPRPPPPPPHHHHHAAAYHDHDDSTAPAPEAGPGDLGSEEEKQDEEPAASAPSPPRAAAAAAYHDHDDSTTPAPDAGSGYPGSEEEEQDEELAASAPAPAPASDGDGEGRECDLFDGSWVRDPARYPLYEAAECPFLSDQVTCRRNGRPDAGYEQWRWQPRGCGAGGRLDGAGALEQLRNRRVVFVGDSLNRNMWESLACILYTALPDRSRARVHHASSEHKIFRAMDYNCSVEFFWSPFLVQLETKPDRTKVLKLDQLPAMLQQVIGADVLVFNTGHWWTHTGKLRAWDHLERNGMLVKMEGEEAFSRALRTWARWVDHNVDQTRTRVFFRSVSPEHKGANWCYNQTAPIAADEPVVPWFPKSMVSIVERSIGSMRTPAAYLNITRLSELRIDAHPSVYSINRDGKPLTLEQRRQPIAYADCSHWCLPGLPDTWNVLLLASLTRYPSSNVHL